MPPDPDGVADWVKWLFGIWTLVSMGLFGHIYSHMASAKAVERLESSLDDLRKELESRERETWRRAETVAGQMGRIAALLEREFGNGNGKRPL
jgi:hypothetical protein